MEDHPLMISGNVVGMMNADSLENMLTPEEYEQYKKEYNIIIPCSPQSTFFNYYVDCSNRTRFARLIAYAVYKYSFTR